MGLQVIIMAGGEGKRMRSTLPKVLHKVGGVPILEHIINAVYLHCNPEKVFVVSGKNADLFKAKLAHLDFEAIPQVPALGTGDAVCACLPFIEKGDVLILNGDTPLIGSTLKGIIQNGTPSLMVMDLEDPTGQGRIVKDAYGNFEKIVEDKDATEHERTIKTVNCGVYHIKSETLHSNVPNLKCSNAQNEYYLTDICEMIKNDLKLYHIPQSKNYELLNVNTPEDLEKAEITINKYGNSLLQLQ